jgi:neutral ceramidase
MKNVILVFFSYIFLTSGFSSASDKTIQGWKAGVARQIITPPENMWMGGYASRTTPSIGKIHDLWAKALALQDEKGQKSVLVSFDLSGMPKSMSDRIRDRLASSYQLSRKQILLNLSHTHSGAVLQDYLYHVYPLEEKDKAIIEQYSKKLEDQVVQLVGDALEALEPAQLSSANGVARFQVNRRNNIESVIHLQNELNGPNDYAVPVIKIADNSGEIIAIAFGYACHPTVLSENKWSGDYVGYAQIELEKMYPSATALFFQGAGGNQNPLPRRTIALAQQYGKELAGAVERVLNEEMKILSPTLSLSYAEIPLPLNDVISQDKLLKMSQETSGHYQRWANIYYQKLEKGEPTPKNYPYPVQVWKVGEQTIVSLGGEPVVEYAIGIKHIFGRDTFVFGYSNDVMAYIPTGTILKEGGYEGATSQMAFGLPGTWKPNIELLIFQEIRRLAKNVEVPH